MESILYLISIFSEELLLFQGAFITIMASAYFGYLVLKKRRYGVFNKNTSAFVVKEYLNEVIGETEEIRNQLFGILNGGEPTLTPRAPREPSLSAAPATAASSENSAPKTEAAPAPSAVDTEKLNKLEKQISELTAKAGQLEKDKNSLEEKLKNQPEGQALTGDSAELATKMKSLEDRLAEYSIIEDDLANLKKLQQENAQLKAALEAKGGAAPPVIEKEQTPPEDPPPPPATAAAEKEVQKSEPAPLPEEAATPNFDELVDNVEKSLEEPPAAPPEPETTVDAAPAPAPAPEVKAPAEAEAQPAATASKEDDDLLKEFERMLNV